MTRPCTSVFRSIISGNRYGCDLEAGHDGEHVHRRPGVTRTWADPALSRFAFVQELHSSGHITHEQAQRLLEAPERHR